MLVGIVSDIHSNVVALDAVLRDMGPVGALWCLGDVVGYGPNPNECIDCLVAQPHLDACLTGNHDAAVLGKVSVADFNAAAQQAVLWTREQLTAGSRQFLAQRPSSLVADGEFTLAHGSPRDPIWEYIIDTGVARANFACFETPVCLVGHTHVPAVFAVGGDGRVHLLRHGTRLALRGEQRYIVNPGSVGQPRDGDPRAAYAVFDSEQGVLEFRRVAYDIAETQQRMRAARLPARLVERLDYGW
jgi:diadenosine tetraphosphatase ApaH/serine/threonine PP2A family protein phosphatase